MSDLSVRVQSLLAGLGDVPSEVAENLRAKGVKGVPGEMYCCPVFNYLAAEGIPVMSVEPSSVAFEGGEVEPPWPVWDFIEEFDGGDWPELIAEAE